VTIVDFLILLLGSAGFGFFLTNKLPDSWYERTGFISRMLSCAFCAGTEAGWWLGGVGLVGIIFGTDEVQMAVRGLFFGPAVGVILSLVQAVGQISASLRSISDREER
jgi:hypothetical protein